MSLLILLVVISLQGVCVCVCVCGLQTLLMAKETPMNSLALKKNLVFFP